jgi:hypothetical protein
VVSVLSEHQIEPWEADEMTGTQINKELDKLSILDSKLTDEFIAAGRGHERAFDIMKQSDPLSLRFRALVDQRLTLKAEIHRLYGPDMNRAPEKQPKTISRRVQ